MNAKATVDSLMEVGFTNKGLWTIDDHGNYSAELSELELDPVGPWGAQLDLKRGWTPFYDDDNDLTHLTKLVRFKDKWVKLTAFND